MSGIERDGFIFYKSFYKAVKNLKAEDFKSAVMAILEYGLDGIEAEDDESIAHMVFELVKPNIDANNQKYINGKKGAAHGAKGGRPKADENPEGENQNPTKTPTEPQENPKETPQAENETPKEKEEEEEKDNILYIGAKTPTRSKFVPPTIEEVREYIKSQNYNINPEQFIDYYTARGWELSKGRKIKDWKACVRTWVRNGYDTARNKAVTGYEQHGYTQEDFNDFRKQSLLDMEHFEE